MRERDLEFLGYPGYVIREDGWLINPKGRMLSGNLQGQVRLPEQSGGTSWKQLGWLVAKAFIPQSPGCPYLRFKDGNRFNAHHSNLEWSPVAGRSSHKRSAVLQLLLDNHSVEATARLTGCSEQYVRKIAAERYRELMMKTQLEESE